MIFKFTIIIFFIDSIIASITSISNEESIKNKVFQNYNKLIRPADTVSLGMQLVLKQIINLDEQSQIMTSSSNLFINWLDERLKWNLTNYSISHIPLPIFQIWYPSDLFILNTATNTNGFIPVDNKNNYVYINHEGLIGINLGLISLKTKCKINIYKFPFDEQTCSINIGSWTLVNSIISIYYKEFVSDFNEKSNYFYNSIWSMSSQSFQIMNTTRIKNCYQTSDIHFVFKLKRESLYFMINNVYPCIILNLFSLITFFMPFVSQAAVSISIFLTLSVISSRIASSMPIQSNNLPLISFYFLFSTFYAFISLVWFVQDNYFRTKKFFPKCLEKFLDFFIKKQQNITTSLDAYIDTLNIIVFCILFLCMAFKYLIILIVIIS